jgi:hypothetical protein
MSFGIVVETLCLQLLAFAAFWPDKPMFLIMTAVFLVPALALSPGKSFRQLFFTPSAYVAASARRPRNPRFDGHWL